MEKIILIGGAPTVGKTFFARQLASKLSLPWISTDTIRSLMQAMLSKKEHPRLFPGYYDSKAERYLSKHTPSRIVSEQKKESREVWKGVKALVKKDYCLESFIVEGVAILPSLAHRIFRSDNRIKTLFLAAKNKEQIRKVVYERGLFDDAHKYPDQVKEVEVQWAWMFNQWIKKEAKKYNFRVFEMNNNNYPFKDILSLIK